MTPAEWHARPTENDCNCLDVGRDGSFPLLLHHVDACQHHGAEVRSMVIGLVRGMEAWASDEDGVHAEAWEAYKRAKLAIGEPVEEPTP